MKAGDLDRHIDLLKRRLVENATGEQEEVFEEGLTAWAQVISNKGRDYFAAAQVHNEETLLFRIRYRTDIDSKDRVGYQGKQYNIANIAEIGRREGIEIVGVQAQN